MSLDNPYNAPLTTDESSAPSNVAGIIDELRMTRPWVRLMGILGFMGALLMLLAAVGMIIGGVAGGGATELLGIGFAYLVMGALYAYPVLKLMKYGSAIKRAEQTSDLNDIRSALAQQRSFWRFIGIATAIVIVLYIVGVVFVVLIGTIQTSSAVAP
ncbi:MAG: DUF5362 family protein [Planctomycetota bacterium]